MKALAKFLVPVVCALALAGCGGGGGGGSSGSAFEPPKDTLQISVASPSITTNSFTTITVSVKKQDGTAEADGTSISASISPSTIGSIGGASGSTAGTTATNTLSGGSTSFTFNSAGNAGTATISISVPPINGNPNSVTGSTSITVTAGNTNDPRLQLTASTLVLPLNPLGPDATNGADGFPTNYIGSPFISEVAVQWRHTNGQLVSGTLTVNVSITPVTVAGFSQLDNPTTSWTGQTTTPPTVDGNEFLTIEGSGPVNVTGGIGTIFVHASNVPGTALLTVTAIDPDNSQTISSQLTFTVQGATSNKLPGAVTLSQSGGAVYISGANGAQSTSLQATVTDGSGALIADPNDGQGNTWDNVLFQIVGPSGTDAKLSALNAAGQSQKGTSVVTSTHNGIASVSFQAGSQQGAVQVKATVDRGDNRILDPLGNISLQDPISATDSVIVSDGKLYSLNITSPDTNAILINRVSGSTSLNTGTSGVTIPPDPNATLSLTVTALGTDRQGNPVTPTALKFGSIDTPQTPDYTGVCGGLAGFEICGTQGNPTEGGTAFNAADGHFLTAGGGAGPNDTLIVIGKQDQGAPAGNDDLESAVKVQNVISNTQLNVATAFNLNDTTGAPVTNGLLPYIVGRSTLGNISSPVTTNSIGAASTTLNYPISSLDKSVVIWVQGTGTDTVNGSTKTITDAAVTSYPGVAPATIIISPSPIPGNITTAVEVCIVDALSSPLPGFYFNFAFSNLGVGSGSVDSVPTSGSTQHATDSTGCVITTVSTSGIAASTTGGTTSGTPTLTFTGGGATASATITASGGLVLLASPSAFSNGVGGTVTLTLLNSNGTPVPGVQLVGTCTGDASIGIVTGPGATNSSGKTTAGITANLNGPNSTKSGSCTFTTSTGSPTAVVNLSGVNTCNGTSPAPPGCTATP